jgi:hypothetical protein
MIDPELQPQQKDPRFKDETLLLYGLAQELYLDAVTNHPDMIMEMWNHFYEKYWRVFPPERVGYTCCAVGEVFKDWAKDIEKEKARQIRINSPEYKAEQEVKRIAREKREAEHEAKVKIWEASQQRQRQQDAQLPPESLIEREWDFAGQESAHEFYREFFSLARMGYAAEYEPKMGGYRLPEESGLSQYLFHLSGVVYDQTVFLKTNKREGGNEKVPRSSFVWTYGVMVCGYAYSKKTGRFLDLEDYKLAILGYVTWLRKRMEETEKKRTGHLPDTPAYWNNLFLWISRGFFEGREESVITEPARTLFKLVIALMNDKVEQSFYAELKDEKAFKAFLLDCTSGGRYEDLADRNENCFFTVEKAGRAKVEQFKITLSFPEDRAKVLERTTSLMMNSGLIHTLKDPESRPIDYEELDRQAAKLREQNEREWNESEA